MTPDALQTILTDNFAPWVQALDLRITDSTGGVTLRMPVTGDIARVGGIVCGQALATLADTAMVLAGVAHAGELKLFATTNLDLQFLSAGKGTAILCRAEITRAGKAMVFARAEMTEENSSKTVATATATFYCP